MLDRQTSAGHVIGHHAVEEARPAVAGRHHQRSLPGNLSHDLLLDGRPGQDDAVGSKLQQGFECLRFSGRIPVSGVEEGPIVGGQRRLLDALGHLRKERIAEVRYDDADHVGPLSNQAPGHGVGPIVELPGGLEDPLPFLVGHAG